MREENVHQSKYNIWRVGRAYVKDLPRRRPSQCPISLHRIKTIDECNKDLMLGKLGVLENKGVASREHKYLYGRNRDGFQFDRLQLLQVALNAVGNSVVSREGIDKAIPIGWICPLL